MPHFAELDENNLVLRTTYSTDTDENAHDWLVANLGGTWVRCFYDTPGHLYPGAGWSYDPVAEQFIPPPPIEEEP